MNLNEYQVTAMRTASPLPFRESLIHATLGLTSEAGEVANNVKRHVAYGKDVDRANLIEEAGDILWFVALLADTLGVSLEQIAAGNIAKLAARFPDLKFNSDHATQRDLANEGEAMAAGLSKTQNYGLPVPDEVVSTLSPIVEDAAIRVIKAEMRPGGLLA